MGRVTKAPLRLEDKDGLQMSGGAAVGALRKTEEAKSKHGTVSFHDLQAIPVDIQMSVVSVSMLTH